MQSVFKNKKITLGICGGIAAYKVADWLRELQRAGAEVNVIMTREAKKFISPLTFAALSGRRVHSDMFDKTDAETIPHISLARESDFYLIAPATAHTIARLAHGMADDLLTTVVLAATGKIVLCPAMNSVMFLHEATQKNLEICRSYGYEIIQPTEGEMACGEKGPGRLPDWEAVREKLAVFFSPQDLAGKTVLITAGPTREPIDAARCITNRSSGKMGFALAETALERGAKVTLVSGPVGLPVPAGANFTPVNTALEMHQAVMEKARDASIIVKAAAVSDFRVNSPVTKKVKKNEASPTLDLVRNPDILFDLGKQKSKLKSYPLLVGFAAETENHEKEGRRKLAEKNADLMVVNDISGSDTGFEADTNKVLLIDNSNEMESLPLLSKKETAGKIWDKIIQLLQRETNLT